jgi:hypothetical protein
MSTSSTPGVFDRMVRSIHKIRIGRTTRRKGGYWQSEIQYLRNHRELALEVVLKRLYDRSQGWEYHRNLPHLLAQLDAGAAARACLELIQDTGVHPRVRGSAVEALDELKLAGQSPYFEALVACTEGSQGDVTYYAALALCHSGRREAISLAGAYMIERCSDILRPEFEKALSQIDSDWKASPEIRALAPSLIDAFQSESAKRRWFAADLMGVVQDVRFAEVLRPAVRQAKESPSSLRSFEERACATSAEVALRRIAERHGIAEDLAYFAGLKEKAERENQALEEQKRSERARDQEKAKELRGRICVGMTREDVTSVLGQPTSALGGGAMLGMFGSATGSANAISSLSQKTYCVWRRPEGEWKLVFAGDRLTDIYQTPSD